MQLGAHSARPARRDRLRVGGVLALIALFFGSGCATYSDRMEKAHQAAAVGNYAASIEQVDKVIGVDDPEQLPEEVDSDEALGVLERARQVRLPRSQRRLEIDEGSFALCLVGKDGSLKRRSLKIVPMSEIFEQVDRMPMRKTEMEKANGK